MALGWDMPSTTAPAAFSHRMRIWPRSVFALVLAVLALALCAWFYPPRLAIFERKDPRFQEWSRADGFLRQCDDPLRQDVEPALRWRLLPPMLCHWLGLRGAPALAVPWLGLFLLLAFLAARIDALTGRRGLAVVGTLGFATTGGPITIVNWLGINDGWWLIGLLEAATGRSRFGLVVIGLLGPWVDERFLIGLPLALLVRWMLRSERPENTAFKPQLAVMALSILPYVGLRMWASASQSDAVSTAYLRDMLSVYPYYVSYVPVGWAMGFRALWMPMGAALIALVAVAGQRKSAITLWPATFLTLGVMSAMAWDLSRSTAMVLPVFVLSLVVAARSPKPAGVTRWWTAALLLNLCLPYAHVVGPTLTWNHGPHNLWGWLVP